MTNLIVNFYTLKLKYSSSEEIDFDFINREKHTSQYIRSVVVGVLDSDGETITELITGRKIYKAKEERENRITYTEAKLATAKELERVAEIVRLAKEGYDIAEGIRVKLDSLNEYSKARFADYMRDLEDITDYYYINRSR